MDRIHSLLNGIQESLVQKTNAVCKLKAGDKIKNINPACTHYGSEGIVDKIEEMPENIGYIIGYMTTNDGPSWSVGQYLKKTEDQLISIDSLYDYDIAEEEMESPEEELNDYKKDFFEMSIGSLKAIAQHSQNILDSLENPSVKENLTESWLQGKIAITEDYMRTIHDFVMYVSDADDTISAGDKPGLWDNIRKKKEKEGKNYRPSKPGEKDRPSPEMWKKLTKDK
jgi:hypothetical protein